MQCHVGQWALIIAPEKHAASSFRVKEQAKQVTVKKEVASEALLVALKC
jgi:hypothetical protein